MQRHRLLDYGEGSVGFQGRRQCLVMHPKSSCFLRRGCHPVSLFSADPNLAGRLVQDCTVYLTSNGKPRGEWDPYVQTDSFGAFYLSSVNTIPIAVEVLAPFQYSCCLRRQTPPHPRLTGLVRCLLLDAAAQRRLLPFQLCEAAARDAPGGPGYHACNDPVVDAGNAPASERDWYDHRESISASRQPSRYSGCIEGLHE